MKMGHSVTIKDVARAAGVSVGAVSTAFSKKTSNVHLSPGTRARILQIARENNYTPNLSARAVQSRKSYLLGFFYNASNWYLQMGILQGIRKICSEHDYDIIVYPANSLEQEAHNLGTLHVNNLDGILTIPFLEGERNNYSCYKALADRGIPVVQLLVNFWDEFPMIGRDYRKIGYEAVRAFYEKGHRRIGLLVFENYTNPVQGPSNWALVKGAEKASEEFGTELVIYPLKSEKGGKNYVVNADRTMEQIFRSENRPTALVAASTNLAYGAYACFQRNHVSVPGDISLLACGDDTEPFWQIAPNLSYFPVPMEEIGTESAKYCLGLPGVLEKRKYLLFKELIPGDTIAKPPQTALPRKEK